LGGDGYARILCSLCRNHRDWTLRRGHFEWFFAKTRVRCFHNDGCAKLKSAHRVVFGNRAGAEVLLECIRISTPENE